jgi:hypothetical protein
MFESECHALQGRSGKPKMELRLKRKYAPAEGENFSVKKRLARN